ERSLVIKTTSNVLPEWPRRFRLHKTPIAVRFAAREEIAHAARARSGRMDRPGQEQRRDRKGFGLQHAHRENARPQYPGKARPGKPARRLQLVARTWKNDRQLRERGDGLTRSLPSSVP